MKTFKDYLTESKKVYSFKLKVAGDLPENFVEGLKTRLGKCGVMTFEKVTKTPVQALPMDFPELKNCEVTVFEVVCEYPVIAPEIKNEMLAMGMNETHIRVRGSGEPSEVDQLTIGEEPSGEALLDENELDKGNAKVKHKDYFGDEFNKGFLKDLQKVSKQQKKEDGQGEYKLPKQKQDKEGAKSAIGS
jgi:hypothetical protein